MTITPTYTVHLSIYHALSMRAEDIAEQEQIKALARSGRHGEVRRMNEDAADAMTMRMLGVRRQAV
jgi:hypothetical protein